MTKTTLLTTTLAISALILAGCAHSYQPVVDLKGVDYQRYQNDLMECRNYAEQIDVAGDTATNTFIGAAVGAAAGAALGAATGDAGSGAILGTTLGGFGGGGATAASSVQRQKTIINNCLSGRGYRVLG